MLGPATDNRGSLFQTQSVKLDSCSVRSQSLRNTGKKEIKQKTDESEQDKQERTVQNVAVEAARSADSAVPLWLWWRQYRSRSS